MNEYEFGICDFSDTSPPGGCVDFYWQCQPSDGKTCVPGTSVEWIEEAPTHNGVQAAMPDFGVVHFSNDCWATSFTPGEPVDCYPINVAGVTSPIGIAFHD